MSQPAPRQAALAHLAALAGRPGGRRITPLFDADPERARKFSASLDDLRWTIRSRPSTGRARRAVCAGRGGGPRRLPPPAVRRRDGERHRTPCGDAYGAALAADAGLKAALAGGIDDASKLAAAERNRMRGFVTAIHEGSQRGATGERLTQW